MCIAIVATAGHKVPEYAIKNSFDNNPDGGGCAFISDGAVRIEKGWMDVDTAVRRYNELYEQYGKDNAMLVHFRIATAGRVCQSNCHPFRIKDGAMIHNGTMFYTGHNAPKSDTRIFAERLFNILDYDSVVNAIDKHDFEYVIGYDRLGFLYNDGRWVTAGDWVEDNGVMYSNRSYASCSASMYDDYDNYWRYGA